MRTRRRILGALAAAALAVPAAAATATPAHAIGPTLLPVTVTNSTGRADATFLYVIGIDLSTGRLGYVNSAGTFTAWSGGQIPPSPAPDVSIAGPGNGGSTTIRFPRGFSGRVYFSFGEKLKFFLTPDGLVQPAPWASGDPNYNILFDWSEFTYNDAGLWLNSSQVDMFAIPHAVTVTGATGVTKRTGDVVSDGRNKTINSIKAQSGWGNTAYTRSDGTVLRVLAPGKAAGAGLFSATYLDSYITSAWNAYASKTLTVVPFADQPNTKYFGRTSGNVMNFTNSSGAQVASFNKPSSANVWGCDGNLAAPNDQVVGPISRTLCAALNRGTLGTIDTQPSTNAAQFYQNNPTNQYAKIIHANMVDGKAYAFAFDDVGAFESLVNDGDPRSASIILSPFGAGGGGGGGGIPANTWNTVINKNSNKCVDARSSGTANGTVIQQYTCNNSYAQQYQFQPTSNGYVRINNRNNAAQVLDVSGVSTADGALINLWAYGGGNNQQWLPVDEGGGYYHFVARHSGKCLDVPAASTADSVQLQQYTCNGTAAQSFRLVAQP
ncbi:beta-1,3-glucanase family protein [Catellatospora tritici]|uniref:beta-1,3-glucanase family protein n=1 Tax=Catellatospora tritici TaxID=2851566 RepID=UPI001C2D4D0D|nr:beta-1,3-glucanase family protein [Catellatospora tritici]MBV1850105.1 RICIN domain-containing protein [Catellatospora tritici]